MTKFCLFAGTTEGRRLADFLCRQDTELTVCVATEYGESLLGSGEHLSISHKRLSAEEITKLLDDEKFDLVIDATHPYAEAVTGNITESCRKTDTEYLRLLRGSSEFSDDAVLVSSVSEAAEFLKNTTGNILLTTGSKELQKFGNTPNFSERVYARVLPIQSSLAACETAGLKPSHIIAMQGPFSEEMNEAMLREVNAEWLVTKDGGDAGGFEAKLSAARKANAKLIVIGRPQEQEGYSETEVMKILCERFGFTRTPQVKIVGIGPGSQDLLTREVIRTIDEAHCLIGAGRMLKPFRSGSKVLFEAIAPDIIADFIRAHPEFQRFCVLMSGDSGFYSGTKRLLPFLKECDIEILPGISSLSYLCAKLHTSAEDIHPVSLHGRDTDIIREIRDHARVFALTGGENSVNSICQTLVDAGMEKLLIYVGERLSYTDEKLSKGSPAELLREIFDPLSVVLIENAETNRLAAHGLPDDIFLRDHSKKGLIPMTKSEIRSICLSKLALTEDAVCWDIGSGTGSVSVEMALCAKKGMVYAIEKDPDALDLSKVNAQRLRASNIRFIEGSAPEVLAKLPTPTHVFIGGASGHMREIIELLFSKGTDIRITATAVALETIAELTGIIKAFPFLKTEAVSVQTAKIKQAGDHLLMNGGNPVTIFTMQIG
ncbi:MAG: precorrin-6A reductase [Flexilinea sp.]|nr:precorrin-6A reductase [Flexilinea sp.]